MDHHKFGAADRSGKMWVPFNVDLRSHKVIVFVSYNIQDSVMTNLPQHVDTTKLVELVLHKVKNTSEELLSSRSVKGSLQLIDYFLQFCKNITTFRNQVGTVASGEPTEN